MTILLIALLAGARLPQVHRNMYVYIYTCMYVCSPAKLCRKIKNKQNAAGKCHTRLRFHDACCSECARDQGEADAAFTALATTQDRGGGVTQINAAQPCYAHCPLPSAAARHAVACWRWRERAVGVLLLARTKRAGGGSRCCNWGRGFIAAGRRVRRTMVGVQARVRLGRNK